MGCVIVHDEMDLELLGDFLVDLDQELFELGCRVGPTDVGNHRAGGYIQGGE